ncbi:PREDICTED: transcriptional adapter 2-alpha-like isoform X1 [Priapulus caudatus]|uniref:Transcriptional adapter n=1 Tax=Priapulus caudatus TaxID=37621 RepID=A0ABM1E490_PRICU|nr:PREDICTED: transcriptional adapter 2-alpha-like isoform X1 [Priapulus caudatus]
MEDSSLCCGCWSKLQPPYIRCSACRIENGKSQQLCLQCFSRGYQDGDHRSNHPYEIIRHQFSILSKDWTANEEMLLLDAIRDRGLGNWSDVAKQVMTKNKQQCESHYMKSYVVKPLPSLPRFPEQPSDHQPQPVVYKLSEQPPRPVAGTPWYFDMAGYEAARSEFTTEPDNFAECDLRDIDFAAPADDVDASEAGRDTNDEDLQDEKLLMQEMQFAVINVYLSRLAERWRRHQTVRHCGLLHARRFSVLDAKRYGRTIRMAVEKLRPFMRLVHPTEYDMFIEALHYEAELREQISQLQEYCTAGLTKLSSSAIYRTVKQRREEEANRRRMTTDAVTITHDQLVCKQWLEKQVREGQAMKNITLPNMKRRSAPPLHILGLPGYDKLSTEERELCANIRLVPASYQQFKNLLITEYKKLGYLKLAQARPLVKIDVNKTRKIYDFLVSKGFIQKDPVT